MPNGAAFTGAAGGRPAAGAKWALALLLAINLFNYIDRQILSATLSKIKRDATIFGPDVSHVYAKLGALTTAFMVSYMCLSPVFGRIGDTFSRWKVIGVAVIFWSLATGGTGLATGYLLLFLTRCLVGVGEAAYGPIAPALLSDLYPVAHRGRILSWFYMAIPVGSALGFVIGGQVADTHLGWRGAFLVAVLPGIALGALCFFLNDVNEPKAGPGPAPGEPTRLPTGGPDPTAARSRTGSFGEHRNGTLERYWAVLQELKRNRSFVLCCSGMTASTFVLGGVATVMPLYLFEREARFTLDAAAITKLESGPTFIRSDNTPLVPAGVIDKLKPAAGPELMTTNQLQGKLKGTAGGPGLLSEADYASYQEDIFDACTAPHSLTNGTIALYLGAIIVVSGLVATLLGGLVGDYLRNRGVKGAYFHVSGWGMLVAFPFFLAMLYTPVPVTWVMLFGAVFFLFFNTGPANTVLANVVRGDIRATAFAINILIIHALGDAISPLVIGLITDYSSLQFAFVLVSLLIPVSGALWICGARYLDADTRTAEAADSTARPNRV